MTAVTTAEQMIPTILQKAGDAKHLLNNRVTKLHILKANENEILWHPANTLHYPCIRLYPPECANFHYGFCLWSSPAEKSTRRDILTNIAP